MDLIMELPDSPEIRICAVENKIKFLENSAHTMKAYRNTLAPISRLLPEILFIIFSLLSSFEVLDLGSFSPILSSPISHVCHRWREISLDLPCLWSHINFSRLTPAGVDVMLVRAKQAPLYLEAETMGWNREEFREFKEQIKAHIHHIRQLNITAKREHLRMFRQLVLTAPSLELLSIGDKGSQESFSPVIIPDNLFNGIAPKLTHLRLYNCGISWKSPLLKGLQDLELLSFPVRARTQFYCWLRALEDMPRLERLVLHNEIPSKSVKLSQGLKLTVDLPSLIELNISASVSDCTVVLAHLVLPALTRLCINAKSETSSLADGRAKRLIPWVAQNAHGPQDTEPLQSLFIRGNEKRVDIVAWTMPRQDSDDGLRSSIGLPDETRTRPARLEFSILNPHWRGEDMQRYNALLAELPLNSIVSLTVDGRPSLSKEDWRCHASRWHKLERVRLSNNTVPAFRATFKDAAMLGVSLFPSLKELILSNISLHARKMHDLRDMVTECVELGIPLRTLDLRTCTATKCAVQPMNEIVVDVLGPMKDEWGGLNERRRGSEAVLEEEGGSSEEEGFDGMMPFLGHWDVDDLDDDHYGTEDFGSTLDDDSDDSSGDETWSTD